VIAGFETLLTYVIESLALFGLWAQRRNLAAWLLAAVIVVGAVALGLVVSNIGAMYRLRYPFWVLMVILCAGGITFLVTRFKFSKSVAVNSSREVSS
jgi:divalent metal cation (Fe/Co/Zn/Cd) transporter